MLVVSVLFWVFALVGIGKCLSWGLFVDPALGGELFAVFVDDLEVGIDDLAFGLAGFRPGGLRGSGRRTVGSG
jgi:hypothetical protein